MKKVCAILVLVLSVAAIPANPASFGQLRDLGPFSTGTISTHSLPGSAIFVGTSASRPSWTLQAKDLPSAVAVAETGYLHGTLFFTRTWPRDNTRPLLRTGGRSVPSDRAPPALPSLHQ